ncbi:MAG: hypothetical protein ACI3W8_05345 [Oscillospiraceae bacterium]
MILYFSGTGNSRYIAERIEKVPLRPVPTRQQLEINEPVMPEIIESVTVETFGVDYPEREDRELPSNWFLDEQG